MSERLNAINAIDYPRRQTNAARRRNVVYN